MRPIEGVRTVVTAATGVTATEATVTGKIHTQLPVYTY